LLPKIFQLIYRIYKLRIVKYHRAFVSFFSLYFFLPFSYMSVNKLQHGGIGIYTIRRAIIDGRYISVGWIGFNESYASSQICKLHSPGNYTTSVDQLEVACQCVHANVCIRYEASACMRAYVAFVRTYARKQASQRSHPLGLFGGHPNPASRMPINGLIKRFEFRFRLKRHCKISFNQ